MPGPRQQPARSFEQRRQQTENARRQRRYKHAEIRVRRIADGDPAFTDQQRANLAAILAPAGDRA